MQSINFPNPHLSVDQPATYIITVQGWLDKAWEEWFGGMQMTHPGMAEDSQPTSTCLLNPVEVTILYGQVEDQAALLGTLQRLYAFGLPLLSLELVPPGTDARIDDLKADVSTPPIITGDKS